MKGAVLHIKILISLALVLGIIISIVPLGPSWSQLHLTNNDTFLYATLFCIIAAFFKSASHHPEKKKEITKLFKHTSFRLEHSFNWMAYLFGGVIILGVNSPTFLIEIGHFVFTGAAILLGYITLLIYPETNSGKRWSYFGVLYGLGGFVMGFIFNFYSTAWAEVFAAIPLAIFLFKTIDR
jgi:hypothetical protein